MTLRDVAQLLWILLVGTLVLMCAGLVLVFLYSIAALIFGF